MISGRGGDPVEAAFQRRSGHKKEEEEEEEEEDVRR